MKGRSTYNKHIQQECVPHVYVRGTFFPLEESIETCCMTGVERIILPYCLLELVCLVFISLMEEIPRSFLSFKGLFSIHYFNYATIQDKSIIPHDLHKQ